MPSGIAAAGAVSTPTEELPDASGPDLYAVVDERDELMRALATLPPRSRAVVVLRFFEDMSESQIAETLGCSVGTVQKHVVTRPRQVAAAGSPAPELPVPPFPVTDEEVWHEPRRTTSGERSSTHLQPPPPQPVDRVDSVHGKGGDCRRRHAVLPAVRRCSSLRPPSGVALPMLASGSPTERLVQAPPSPSATETTAEPTISTTPTPSPVATPSAKPTHPPLIGRDRHALAAAH